MTKPLIILDRDGVINHDSPHYVRSADEWTPIDGSIEAIALLGRLGYEVAIATNQAGVAKGVFSGEELDLMHRKLNILVEAKGGRIARIYDCRHHANDGCDCRKPKPGMLLRACEDFGQAPEDVFFVGDSITDIKAARAAGCKPLLVLTGNGPATRKSAEFDERTPCVPSLGHLPQWLASTQMPDSARSLEASDRAPIWEP